ncbi:hypothetical protein EMU01_30660 [Enterococcus mundtii]|uniref:Transposase n=1 Tax=Enterococcus mundtii TaxID=53346 RepID=A0ABQ0VGV4_ENTMU|nr:hypothetical protein EMU01_30660 [Enterococcus mundtii]GEN18514.1 hypothetical protein LAC02_17950 [Ligilactobacillus acidipiscis]
MAKYSFEFKLKIVQEYLEKKGSASYLSKKYGLKSNSSGPKMDQCLSRIW